MLLPCPCPCCRRCRAAPCRCHRLSSRPSPQPPAPAAAAASSGAVAAAARACGGCVRVGGGHCWQRWPLLLPLLPRGVGSDCEMQPVLLQGLSHHQSLARHRCLHCCCGVINARRTQVLQQQQQQEMCVSIMYYTTGMIKHAGFTAVIAQSFDCCYCGKKAKTSSTIVTVH